MEILKGVIKKSIFAIIPLTACSAFIEPTRLPLSILMGWLLGIINLGAISKNVMAFLGTEKATARLVTMNLIRLIGLFSAIAILTYYRIINIFGLLMGFALVFLFIIVEGLKAGRSA